MKAQHIATHVTPSDVEANIASEHYFTGFDGANHTTEHAKWASDWEIPRSVEALGLLTFCVLVMRNGVTVTGESAATTPDSSTPKNGRRIARQKAVSKARTLMVYELKARLSRAEP